MEPVVNTFSGKDPEQVAQYTNNNESGLQSVPTISGQIDANVAPTPASIMEKPLLSSQTSSQVYYGADSTDNLTEKDERAEWGTRHIFALMGFLGLASIYTMRVNLSVAIVDMVIRKSDGNQSHLNDSSSQFCPVYSDSDDVTNDEGEFDWDGPTQGLILGSFFWGYVATQIPGGILASRFGGKTLYGWGVFVTAIFTILSPFAARISSGLFIAFRVIEGLGEGVTMPAVHVMLSRWVPPSERSTIGAFIYAGMQFGTVIAMPLSGALAALQVDNGWPFAFYVPGILGLVWCIAWYFLVFDSPSEHPRISAKEKQYILSHIPHTNHAQIGKTPWKTILTSVHLWAILAAHVGQCWGFYTLLTELPTYMKTVLHFDLASNSTLSALPYLGMWIFANAASWLADYFIRNRIFSTTVIRKSFNTFGSIVPGLILIGAGYSGCDRTLTVTLLTLAVTLNGAVTSGFQVNHLDVAHHYAGIMMGITSMAGNITGILAPYVASWITIDGTLTQWRTVFYISAAIYFINNLIFVILGTGQEQPWNRQFLDVSHAANSVAMEENKADLDGARH